MESLFILCDLGKIIDAYMKILNDLKGPVVLGTSLIAIGYAGWQVFVGGHDRRTIMNNLIGMIIFATLVYGIDKILNWIKNLVS